MSFIELLVKREPWRTNQGQPTILNRAWSKEAEQPPCDGEIEFELSEAGTTGWWFCKECGHCSNLKRTEHAVCQSPRAYNMQSIELYRKKRLEQGVSPEVIEQQMDFICGVALRHAAIVPTEELSAYAFKLESK